MGALSSCVTACTGVRRQGARVRGQPQGYSAGHRRVDRRTGCERGDRVETGGGYDRALRHQQARKWTRAWSVAFGVGSFPADDVLRPVSGRTW